MEPVADKAVGRGPIRSVVRADGAAADVADVEEGLDVLVQADAAPQGSVQNGSDDLVVAAVDVADGSVEAVRLSAQPPARAVVMAPTELQDGDGADVAVGAEEAAVQGFELNGALRIWRDSPRESSVAGFLEKSWR